MFKSILVATDGSKLAKKAVDIAADLAVKYGAALTIVTVAPNSLTVEEVQSAPQARRLPKAVKTEMADLQDMMAKSAIEEPIQFNSVPAPRAAISALSKLILDDAEKAAQRKKVKQVSRTALAGNPADSIISQAKKAKAGLIVMGTRGLSDLGGLVMGSVSHKVIHMASCPCLTVR